MRITAVDEELYTNNNSGTGFGVTMGSKLFSVLTESLYKDKPRAVCRETIANCVDAHRMRDSLFAGVEEGSPEWDDLISKGYATPGTPFNVHLPTDIEPWLEFEDFGIGLPIEKILGEIQYMVDPHSADKTPVMVCDGKGHPVRSGGVYTTLFGSDKEDNNDAIGAYGLGCKSPFAIVDTFLVKSRVNGEEHQYLMFLNSKREPQVDWLTKDPVTGEPSPLKTEKKNGLCVRMDAIPVSMKGKITVSVADILQTFPKEEQPIVNDGMFTYKPVEYRDFIGGLKIVEKFHYGHVFNNSFVVNTGGVVYPIDRSKLEELMGYTPIQQIYLYAQGKCILLEMALGTVNIPPSREEISYDEITMENISAVLKPAVEYIEKLKAEILDKMELNLSSLWKARSELMKLEPDTYSQTIRAKWDSLVEEKKKMGREAGVAIGYRDNGFKAYAQFKGEFDWVVTSRDFRIYKDNYYGLNAVNMDDYVLTDYATRRVCSESKWLLDITDMSDRKAIVVLNDSNFSRGTVLTRLKKLREEDLVKLIGGLVDVTEEDSEGDTKVVEGKLPSIVIMVGASNKEVPVPFDDYVKFTEYMCRVGNFNYVLGTEVCELYDKMPRRVKGVTQSEIQRNVKALRISYGGSSRFFEESAPNDLFDEDKEENFTYLLRDEVNQLNLLFWSSEFLEHAISRGVLEESTFIVTGTRTDSRKMCDASPNFRRVDIPALVKLNKEFRLNRLEFIMTRNSPLKDPVAKYGLKSILGALLFSEFLYDKTGFSSVGHFLSWMQVFVNRHPLTSFEENDIAFQRYGKFTLGQLYNRLVDFHKILGWKGGYLRSYRAGVKLPQERLDLDGLETFRKRYERVRSPLEDNLDANIWEFSHLNIAPWKEDMDMLAQMEATFCEKEFRNFHGGVFPTVHLRPGMVKECELIDSKLERMKSKVMGQIEKIMKEHTDVLSQVPSRYHSNETEYFIKRLKQAMCSCTLGEFQNSPLLGTRDFFPQFKTSAEIEEERLREEEKQRKMEELIKKSQEQGE